MLDITQAITLLVIITLTILVLFISYQVIMILQEVRKSFGKVNQILDNAEKISESVADPIVNVSGFLTGLRGGAQIISLFTKGKSKEVDDE